MNKRILSDRLLAAASLVNGAEIAADIGTDHGLLPVYLVEQNRAKRAIAMDLRTEPLKRAADYIREVRLSSKIDVRLSDGFEKMEPFEADIVTILGMGGPLITKILEKGKSKLNSSMKLILSPQSEYREYREYLSQNGFVIEAELALFDRGKFYCIETVRYTGEPYELTEAELEYGPCLVGAKDAKLIEQLKKEEGILSGILENLNRDGSDKSIARREEIRAKLSLVQGLLER